ncbi:MAG: tyrosine-type recombinase/integrase [Desulfovibrio sp.]|nr:tyrosine-type recombinase/integrase [Desulfovibrio sp.]
MNKLTDTFLRGIKPTGKIQKHSDGGGLFIHVTASGSPSVGGVHWRMAYRFDGKQKLLSFGAYPAVSLKDARARREEAKEYLAKGIDPGVHKQAAKAAAEAKGKTFARVAEEWFSTLASERRPRTQAKSKWVLGLLEPIFGDKPLVDLEPCDILAAVRPVEQAGHVRTAHEMVQVAGQVCRFGRSCGYTKFNAADGLSSVLKPYRAKHHAAILSTDKLRDLLMAIEKYVGSISIQYALKILPHVVLRNSELRGAYWPEIDFDKAIWTVPASRGDKHDTGMKTRIPHVVPLSRQVLKLFSELYDITGNGKLCFPSPWSRSACISDMGLLNALYRMGFKEDMSIHGFRSVFSTILNEQGVNSDYIEAQLAHKSSDKVRDAYNRAEYMVQRRAIMQSWSDYLDSLRESAAVTFSPDVEPDIPPVDRPRFVLRQGGKVIQ